MTGVCYWEEAGIVRRLLVRWCEVKESRFEKFSVLK